MKTKLKYYHYLSLLLSSLFFLHCEDFISGQIIEDYYSQSYMPIRVGDIRQLIFTADSSTLLTEVTGQAKREDGELTFRVETKIGANSITFVDYYLINDGFFIYTDLDTTDRNVEEFLKTLNDPIFPSNTQFSRLLQEDTGQSVEMLNFLKYYESAQYPPDFTGKRSNTGEGAYNQYGKVAMRTVAKLGGYLTHAGKVERSLIDTEETIWDDYAIMLYPSRSAFKTMFTLEGKPDGIIQRNAGLAQTKVFAFSSDASMKEKRKN